MAERRVVFPLYVLKVPIFSKQFWSMVELLVTSVSSYFDAGNTVPVIVGTNSVDVRRIVTHVAEQRGYPVEVIMTRTSEMESVAGKYAKSICKEGRVDNRLDVVTAKLFAMIHLGAEYDRLVVDADTIWFREIPWERFAGSQIAIFTPEQWEHPMSVRVGQILDFRRSAPLDEYVSELIRLEPDWKGISTFAGVPWPNSGIVYMGSGFAHERYARELDNPVLAMLAVEDEAPLFSLLLKGECVRYRDIQMNVPVAFYNDIIYDADILHPGNIVCAHFHRNPKPTEFNIGYDGKMDVPGVHHPFSLSYVIDSMATGQYGTMSGILWCYVWRYYFSANAVLYRNGETVPIYDQAFWKGIIETFCDSRRRWNTSIDGQRMLQGMNI